jgi:dihydroorotate dehydrogenase (NAD+) catalytic subunit
MSKNLNINLSVDIAGVTFKNPVMAASGTFGFGREFEGFFDLSRLGAISVKGLTLEPRQGNNPPRIAEVPAGILNSVGLQNPGVHRFIQEEIPFLRKFDTKIIANVSGSTIEDYCSMVEILSDADIDAIELNVSCPNVKQGCIAFGNTPAGIAEVTANVRKYCTKPLIVKMTPNVLDITEIAMAAENSGADALSLINTILALAIDIKTKKPILHNNYGGLSGPSVKPIALRMVNQVSRVVDIPVIGMGGISSWEDAIEFFLAGAKGIMVGTYNFVNPLICVEIIQGIQKYLHDYNHKDIDEIIGKLKLN